MFHTLWDDTKNHETPVSGHETTAGNLHLNANGFLILLNYRDNDVVIGGEIKFAWTLAIQAEMKTHKEQRFSLCLNLHINLLNGRQNQSYNATQEWLLYMNQALAELLTVKTKTRVILYSNPSVLDEEGVLAVPPTPLASVCSPQVHVSLTQPESLFEPTVDRCRSLFCNAFNFAVDTCNRLYLLWTVVTGDLFLTWSCSQLFWIIAWLKLFNSTLFVLF